MATQAITIWVKKFLVVVIIVIFCVRTWIYCCFLALATPHCPPSPSLLLLLMWTRPMDSPSLPLLLRRNKMTIFSLFCPPPSPLRGATVLLSAAFHWAHVGVLGEGWDSGRASTERSKSILAFRKVNGKSGLTLERCFALFAKKDFSFQNILYMLLSYTFICSSICMHCWKKKK